MYQTGIKPEIFINLNFVKSARYQTQWKKPGPTNKSFLTVLLQIHPNDLICVNVVASWEKNYCKQVVAVNI